MKTIMALDILPRDAQDNGLECCFAQVPSLLDMIAPLVFDPQQKKFQQWSQVLKAIIDLDELRNDMLASKDFEPFIQKMNTQKCNAETIVTHAVTRGDEGLGDYTGTKFNAVVDAFINTCGVDARKASEVVEGRWNEEFVATIVKLEAIAGGAQRGEHWYASFDASAPNADLMEHFDSTLGKLDVNQVVEMVRKVSESMETFARARPESESKDALLSRSCKSLLQARVTQLETFIFRSIRKSRKPANRIEQACANFDTEDHPGGPTSAYDAIGAPVRKFIQDGYQLLMGPPPLMAADGGA